MMKYDKILLAHGNGGLLGNELVEDFFLPFLSNPVLNKLNDQGIFQLHNITLALTTDSYVVHPIFFPGGDIGELAVNGTVNDLAIGGARPLYLSLGLIIEEGFLMKDLQAIFQSIKNAASEAEVQIITGDTKVVNKGGVDGIFINTSGIGIIESNQTISADNLQIGDRIIVSGTIADHGMTIIAAREGLIFDNPLKSDTAPLNKLVKEMLLTGAGIHAMRDPTRGGLSSTLNEFAKKSNVGIIIEEEKIPIRKEVKEACEILGMDPMKIASEGKLVAVVKKEDAETLLHTMRKNPTGQKAEIIGEVVDSNKGKVIMKTMVGSSKIVDMAMHESLPRIC
jgi:hydrogenase expression/formation protein HypE